jgi:hypothetical protein
MCQRDETWVPTLYIKSNLLDLHLIRSCTKLHFDIFDISENAVMYFVGYDAGLDYPCMLYSAVETMSEKEALLRAMSGAEFDVFLFNDFAFEIARSVGNLAHCIDELKSLKELYPLGSDYEASLNDLMSRKAQEISEAEASLRGIITVGGFESRATSHVISGSNDRMTIHGFTRSTEVHEQLPLIIGDHTDLVFAHSPQVIVSNQSSREFCDAVVFGDEGLMCIQAKSFELDGTDPPTDWLSGKKRMTKSIGKASRQCLGCARMLSLQKLIFFEGGLIEPHNPQLISVFVPSLSLITDEANEVLLTLDKTLQQSGRHLAVLDPMQFLRILQAAEPYSNLKACTKEKAFFEILVKFCTACREQSDFSLNVLYRW